MAAMEVPSPAPRFVARSEADADAALTSALSGGRACVLGQSGVKRRGSSGSAFVLSTALVLSTRRRGSLDAAPLHGACAQYGAPERGLPQEIGDHISRAPRPLPLLAVPMPQRMNCPCAEHLVEVWQ